MPPTLTRSLPPQATASPGRTAAGWAAAGVAALLAAIVAGEVLEPPATRDLVVANQSDRDVTVVVASAGGGGRLPIATLDPGEERAVEGVLDQGSRWVLSFRVPGEPVDTLEVTSAALEADGYRITVPAEPVSDAGTQG